MTQTLSFAVDPDAEETARAEVYGLLAASYFLLCFGLSRLAQRLDPARTRR